MALVFEELLALAIVLAFLVTLVTQVVLPQFYGKRWFPWFRKNQDGIDRLSEAQQRRFEAQQAAEAARVEADAAEHEKQARGGL